MKQIAAKSPAAARALSLCELLQQRLVAGLEAIDGAPFCRVAWLRDDGVHGGGARLAAADTPTFNRASVNVSQVHYDDMPDKRLGSATALSTIVHPANPHGASMHMHISWTELRDGSGSWRIMADLNPSIPSTAPQDAFEAAMRQAAPEQFAAAREQGQRYFFIPSLQRHRGVSHFYLEGYRTDDAAADLAFAERFGLAVVQTYCAELAASLRRHPTPSDDDRAAQLHYHTVYLLQVLTLDRGTTSGLLVHDDNDVGILGSLPARVDRALLASWIAAQPAPQDALLTAIVDALPASTPTEVTVESKQALAGIVRAHYRAHPAALSLQAAADVIPPTVENHR